MDMAGMSVDSAGTLSQFNKNRPFGNDNLTSGKSGKYLRPEAIGAAQSNGSFYVHIIMHLHKNEVSAHLLNYGGVGHGKSDTLVNNQIVSQRPGQCAGIFTRKVTGARMPYRFPFITWFFVQIAERIDRSIF